MTELRTRMIECLQLRGLSERTQEAYVRAVRQLAAHYHKSPDLITEEELRQYFLFIKNVKHYSSNTSTIAICGIKFFFEKTLNRNWSIFGILRAPREKKLPVILSVEEVRKILGCLRLPRYRVCLSTIYSCGLRLQEGTHLQVRDIDSARMMIHVRHGKGNKDRYVPLPERTLELLRQYWASHRNPVWLFPSPGHGDVPLSISTEPMARSSLPRLVPRGAQSKRHQPLPPRSTLFVTVGQRTCSNRALTCGSFKNISDTLGQPRLASTHI